MDKEQYFKRFIAPQKRRARQLGLDFIQDIQVSPLKNKKYRVILSDGSHVDYGYPAMEDYLQHRDPLRRERFFQRWGKHPQINNPRSAVFYITRLNW